MLRLLILATVSLAALSCSRVGDGTDDQCASNAIYSTTYSMGVNDDGINSKEIAQPMLVTGSSPTNTKNYTEILLPLYYGGTAFAGGTTTLSIRENTGNQPGALVSGGQATVNLIAILSTPTLTTFSFTAVPSLTIGTTYWLVLSATYAQTSTNVLRWAGDDLARGGTTYSGGYALYNSQTILEGYTDSSIGSGRALGFTTTCANP